MPDADRRLIRYLHVYCVTAALLVLGIAGLVLCGWAFKIDGLIAMIPGLVTMKANTAVCLALAAGSLLLLVRQQPREQNGQRAASVLGLVVALIGAATASEYLFGVDWQIDQLLFFDTAGSFGTSSPGRMAPMTAFAFISMGLSLTLVDQKGRIGPRPAQVLSLFCTLTALMALSGYIYHATSLYRLFLYTQIALPTAVSLMILGTAIFFARPLAGIAGDLTGTASGSVMARRLLPPILVVPIGLGWVCRFGETSGLYSTELGLALFATTTVVVLTLLLWLVARQTNREHSRRGKAEADVRELNAVLEDRVAERTLALEQQTARLVEQATLLDLAHDAIVVRDLDSRILFWNRGAEALFGWSAAEALGRFDFELLRSEYAQPLAEIRAQLLLHGQWQGESVQHSRDGHRLKVGARWVLQRDVDGGPFRTLIIVNDITERQKADARFRALLDAAPDAMVVVDQDGRIVLVNAQVEKVFGYPREQLLGQLSDVLVPARFRARHPQHRQGFLTDPQMGGAGAGLDRFGLRKDGSEFPVEISLSPLDTDDGVLVSSAIRDVSERKQVESRLLLVTERLSLATAVAQMGVWEWDLVSNTLQWDDTMFTIYGFTHAVPMPFEELTARIHPEDVAAVEATFAAVVKGKGQGSAEFRIVTVNGIVRTVSSVERAILDEAGKVIRLIGVDLDVTERKAAEEILRKSEAHQTHSAQHDFLTGLPNRMLLNDRLTQATALALRHVKKVAVLFLDLDGFKHINDSLGHRSGDRLLQSVATRLIACVRTSDTVSRSGGDEFVVLLSEIDQAEDAAIAARRILKAVADPHTTDQHVLHVSASIGVSVFPDDGCDAETLIKNADTAMYQAKEHRRQGYQFFTPAMNVRAVERQFIEGGLRHALERQELAVHYQPMADLTTGEITGAEALIRWTHPVRGLISPAQFIPVAEDCGLILPIGNWVLRQACEQAQRWADAGLSLARIAVNISAIEFRGEGFLDGVFRTLEQTGLDPRRLELELTEGVVMKHAETSEFILKALRQKGVRLALDDFGTGYSSLSYLSSFPIDVLKIDQSFVRQISTAPTETAIVSAVIGMARNLKLRVVAEGVETQAELEFLRGQHCDEAQGYYFGRPVAPAVFERWLEAGVGNMVFRQP